MYLQYNNIHFKGNKEIRNETIHKIGAVNAILDLFATIKEYKKKHKTELQYHIAKNNLPIKQNKSTKEIIKRLENYNKNIYCSKYISDIVIKVNSTKKYKQPNYI